MVPDTFVVALQVLEVLASCVTALSLLAIAIHEIGSDGWRVPKEKVKK